MKRKRNLTIAVVVVLVVGCFAFLEGPRVWTFLITQPEANLQRPNVWAGYGSVVRWRTGPDPTEGQARVLRFGENRGIRHGPFHVGYPDGSSLHGQYDTGRRVGIWQAIDADGVLLWTGIPHAHEFTVDHKVMRIRELDIEIEERRWRIRMGSTMNEWIRIPGHLRRAGDFLVVTEVGTHTIVGFGSLEPPFPHMTRFGHSLTFRADGTLESIRQVGTEGFEGLWTWFNPLEEIIAQVVYFEGEEKDHRIRAPWYDVRSALDPHQPILHPITGQRME